MSKRKFAWTWADYYRQLAIDERRAKRAAERRRKDQQASRRGHCNSDKGAASPKEVRCEGGAPEGASGTAAARKDRPANATQARPPILRSNAPLLETGGSKPAKLLIADEVTEAQAPRSESGKIDLSTAPSGMERAAERWSSPVAYAGRLRDREKVEAEKGRAFCRCGGNGKEGGFVPAWFGRDCIEKDCALRGCR